MKNKTAPHSARSGSALIMAIGFLAVLTLILFAFSLQTRTERVAGREFMRKAQALQLLNTARTRALEDLDAALKKQRSPIYPGFLALGSPAAAAADGNLADTIRFTAQEAYLPGPGSPIHQAYLATLANSTRWQTVTDAGGSPVGRVGYLILNTSGQLDANTAGGYRTKTQLKERRNGRSPAEIQLSPLLLPELSREPAVLIHPDGSTETVNHSAPAFVYNRKHAWQHFETLRELYQLNESIFTRPTENFRTFSRFLPETGEPQIMGHNTETLNQEAVRQALTQCGLTNANQNFVLQQLKDYLDEDSIPQNLRYSVEPVPMLNELLMSCSFTLAPSLSDGDSNVTVEVSTSFSLDIEAWMPFTNAAPKKFIAVIDNAVNGLQPITLFGGLSELQQTRARFEEVSQKDRIYTANFSLDLEQQSYDDISDFIEDFDEISGGLEQLSISCATPRNKDALNYIDRAAALELPLNISSNTAASLAGYIFSPEGAVEIENSPDGTTNFSFVVGSAAIDPRLNWDGQNPRHWVETGDNGYAESIGEINRDVIAAETQYLHPDISRRSIYVRNENQIDSAYEFTYFLCSTNRPWQTFQFFKELDIDRSGTRLNTRKIASLLNARPNALRGGINPNTTNPRVLASAFYRMPIDEQVHNDVASTRRLNDRESIQLFRHVAQKRPFKTRHAVAESLTYDTVDKAIGGNSWQNESILRNALDLLAVRDSTFILLLAAQQGIDRDADGIISDHEASATQKALAQIWRDPLTGQSACTFWGQHNADAADWAKRLEAFRPNQPQGNNTAQP